MNISGEKIQALIDFATGEACCPCCEGVLKCEIGCTIEADCNRAGGDAINTYNRMIAARFALNTK